ncbi:MAG: hypothetical protein ACXAEU_13010 [Candidatus Hodarchaeales archaeon]|jgi:hypothetical protein
MFNSGNNQKKRDSSAIESDYIELIEADSLLRYQMHKLFIDSGLDDFEAQILLSIVLHGGQMKSSTLADDLGCNSSRLELPDGLPSLIQSDLIVTSHHRPKTLILAMEIEDLLERLSIRSLRPNRLLTPEEARELLQLIDKFHLRVNGKDNATMEDMKDNPLLLKDYYDELALTIQKLPSLFFLLDVAFFSLKLERNKSIILSQLVVSGGKTDKRAFYRDKIKNFDLESLYLDKKRINDDLRRLGYQDDQANNMQEKLAWFYRQKVSKLQLSTEHYFNLILSSLSYFCHFTSMGKKSKKQKEVKLALIHSITQIAEKLYQEVENYPIKQGETLFNLKMAYSNVKLIDTEIFLSTIADPSSTKRRINKDIQHAVKVLISCSHTHFIDDIYQGVFDSDNKQFSLHILAPEEQKDFFYDSISRFSTRVQNRRGILPRDMVTFIPSKRIPQDVLIDNTILLFYKVGASMIVIHEEITKENPVEINTIADDVSHASETFNAIIEKYSDCTVPIAKS